MMYHVVGAKIQIKECKFVSPTVIYHIPIFGKNIPITTSFSVQDLFILFNIYRLIL